MKRSNSRYEIIGLGIAFAILGVVLPMVDSYTPIQNVLGVDLSTIGKYLSYALLAISVDLLWGYTGLLSLGQAIFFSVGGYMLGMHLMLLIGKLGQYKSDLPDFMVFQGHTDLPTFWKPFYSFGFATAMVIIMPGLLALVFGFFAFRSRIKGVYFSILTQALTYGAALVFFQNDISLRPMAPYIPQFVKEHIFIFNDMPMGGNNGFTDFKFILGHDIHLDSTKRALFIVTVAFLAGTFLLCRWITKTKFGLIQRAVRDSETRVLFSGYAAANFKLFVFVLSAVIASIGGAMFVAQVKIINPNEMATDKSLDAVVWVAVGGRGTLYGPILGAVLVNWFRTIASSYFPDYWLIILGSLFILVVMLMPKGIVGLPAQLRGVWKRWKLRQQSEAEEIANAEITPEDSTITTVAKQ